MSKLRELHDSNTKINLNVISLIEADKDIGFYHTAQFPPSVLQNENSLYAAMNLTVITMKRQKAKQ